MTAPARRPVTCGGALLKSRRPSGWIAVSAARDAPDSTTAPLASTAFGVAGGETADAPGPTAFVAVIAEPPSDAGCDHVTSTAVWRAATATWVGAPGTFGGFGVTPVDAALGGLVPASDEAATVNVYFRPLTSPPTSYVVDAPSVWTV